MTTFFNLSTKMDLWIKKNYNVILEGKHGVGKTEMIKQKFDSHNLRWLYFSASTMDPWVDFIGIPKATQGADDKVEYMDILRPKYFAYDEVDAIFLDEYNRSDKKVRNATMELIQFKSINGKKLKNLKFIWVAVNPSDETYDVEPLDPAQRDRFQIYYKMPYVVNNEYFIEKYGELGDVGVKWWNVLSDEQKDAVSPRRLDYVLDYVNSNGDLTDVLPPDINFHPLLDQLDNGVYVDKLIKMFNEKNDQLAIKSLTNANFYNACIDKILSSRDYLDYFCDKIPEEKIAQNLLSHLPFLVSIMKVKSYTDIDGLDIHINNAAINGNIKQLLVKWKERSKSTDAVKSFLDENKYESLEIINDEMLNIPENQLLKVVEKIKKDANTYPTSASKSVKEFTKKMNETFQRAESRGDKIAKS